MYAGGRMAMESLWKSTAAPARFAPLDRDLRTDVLIIGGGMCGLLCARLLDQAGVDYALVEADTLCGGISANTTAKITAQHGLIYHKLIKRFGAAKAARYLQANLDALECYAQLCSGLDCDFEFRDAYVYSLNSREKLEQEASALAALGVRTSLCDSLPLPFDVAGAIRWPGQAQFHPLKFARAIAGGLRIYEHTRVKQLMGTKAVTNAGTVQAKKIIVATHFPFLNKHGLYFLKLYQHRSYVIALQNAPLPNGMFVDESQTGLSFRTSGGYLLIGGGGHRTGKPGGGWQPLRDFAHRHYPQAVERFHWAAQDYMTLDGAPYIGPYAAHADGLYAATGFQKWGMTSSMAAAALLCDLVRGKDNPALSVFFPLQKHAARSWRPTPFRRPTICSGRRRSAVPTWAAPCSGTPASAAGIAPATARGLRRTGGFWTTPPRTA